MIQFEIDYILDFHQHWLRDSRFSRRADLTGRILENLNIKYKDLSGAILDGARFHHCNLSNSNFSDIVANGVHFDVVDFTDSTLRNAHLDKAYFTDCTFSNTDLWDVRGDGVFIISLQLGGKNICYTSDILQINCKQYDLEKVWWMTDEEMLHSLRGEDYDNTRAGDMEWW